MKTEACSRITAAAADNAAALAQAIELLGALDAERYARRQPGCFNSSAGGHLRHVLEHYTSFLHGLGSGLIDYETRARDLKIETDPKHALRLAQAIQHELTHALPRFGNRPLRVRLETARAEVEDPWGASSVLRELEFLLSHTIHHFALIGVICGLGAHDVPENFGVAPSTLRYREAQAAADMRLAAMA